MHGLLTFLFIVSGAIATPVHASELNAGFVQGIWYSKPSVFSGETVRIYVALRNNTDHDLTGIIRFDDNDTKIGNSYVTALPGRLVEGWVDWTPSYGDHTITATLTDVRKHEIGEDPERVDVASITAENMVIVDHDTDHDEIGNKTDPDDDGDGVSDTDEATRGTDPLVKNPVAEDAGTGDENSAASNEAPETPVNNTATQPTSENDTGERGLERFVSDGVVDTVLSRVTDGIAEKKHTLDDYRESRADELTAYMKERSREDGGEVMSVTTSGELATITRSRIDGSEGGFIEAAIDAGKAIVNGVYTFLLWLTSSILDHPVILELALLIGILYVTFRLARRFGRRPQY